MWRRKVSLAPRFETLDVEPADPNRPPERSSRRWREPPAK
jgi:hypothetical protein